MITYILHKNNQEKKMLTKMTLNCKRSKKTRFRGKWSL